MATAKQYGPGVIAQSFIKQYYEKLARNPQDLHKFYKDNSFFTYVDGVQDSDPVSGTDEIKDAVNKLPFLGCRVDLSEGSLDAQTSDGGVLIVVTGDIAWPGEPLRHFVQSFFLDSQHSGPSPSYYVRNSVLRLLRNHGTTSSHATGTSTEDLVLVRNGAVGFGSANNKAESPALPPTYVGDSSSSSGSSEEHAPSPAVESTSAPASAGSAAAAAPAEAAATFQGAEPTTTSSTTAAGGEDNVSEAAATVSTSDSSSDVATPSSTPASSVPSGPVSYRDMMLRAAANKPASTGAAATGSAPAPAPAPKKKAASKPASAPAPAPAAGAEGTSAAPAAAAAAAAAPTRHVLYVKLPESTTVEEFKAVFAPYGTVVHVDVLNQKGYGFVEMDSAASSAAVLAATGLTLKGKPINAEERNVGSKGSKGKDGNGGKGGDGHKGGDGGNKDNRRNYNRNNNNNNNNSENKGAAAAGAGAATGDATNNNSSNNNNNTNKPQRNRDRDNNNRERGQGGDGAASGDKPKGNRNNANKQSASGDKATAPAKK